MDLVDPKVELIHDFDTLAEQDLLEENYFEHFGNDMGTTVEQDSQPVFCSGNLINALSDTALSSELVSPEQKLININALTLNSENVMTEHSFPDTNFAGNMFQLSCLGSDSMDLLSPTEFNEINDSETEWLLSECEDSHLKKTKLKSTRRDKGIGMINSPKQGSGDGSRRSYCIGNSNSKNAIAARDNRLKKKKYIADLEETINHLQVENERLQEQSKKNGHTMCELQNEVSYLRKVIANQSTLSAILKNVMKTPGVTLTTSFNSAMNCKSSKKERIASDNSSCDRNCNHNVRSCQNNDVNCVDAHEQADSDLNVASSRNSKRASKRNVKGKMVNANSQTKCGRIQENKHPSAVGKETFGDSDSSDVSIDNIQGGICLHVSGQNVSLEFCPLCNKNAYLGLITDHSYVKS